MNGFEIARFTLDEACKRVDEIKDSAILPVDERGEVIGDDGFAADSAREIRLLMQRILELDAGIFLEKMRGLFFHLFAVDHEHFRDLLMQAARQRPEAVRDFAFEFLFSKDVLFIDDQETLHELMDVLESLDPKWIEQRHVDAIKSLWTRPFFRLPSLVARSVRWVSPSIRDEDMPEIRRLFEMDWIPPEELIWPVLRETLRGAVSAILLKDPVPQPENFLPKVKGEDFDSLRWMAGIDGPLHSLRFRLLGALVAVGPWAETLFLEICEFQPESVFQRDEFETAGHGLFFREALLCFRRETLREAHRSTDWFSDIPEEPARPWTPTQLALDPWPPKIRYLSHHWAEFIEAAERSDFHEEAAEEIAILDKLAERSVELVTKQPLPSMEALNEGETLFKEFLAGWRRILPKALDRLGKLP